VATVVVAGPQSVSSKRHQKPMINSLACHEIKIIKPEDVPNKICSNSIRSKTAGKSYSDQAAHESAQIDWTVSKPQIDYTLQPNLYLENCCPLTYDVFAADYRKIITATMSDSCPLCRRSPKTPCMIYPLDPQSPPASASVPTPPPPPSLPTRLAAWAQEDTPHAPRPCTSQTLPIALTSPSPRKSCSSNASAPTLSRGPPAPRPLANPPFSRPLGVRPPRHAVGWAAPLSARAAAAAAAVGGTAWSAD
jgi:hypothetical protein